MRRVGTPKGLDRRTHKLAEGDDPDFYAMPPVAAARSAAPPQPLPPPAPAAARTGGGFGPDYAFRR
jgi:hypothetical protein